MTCINPLLEAELCVFISFCLIVSYAINTLRKSGFTCQFFCTYVCIKRRIDIKLFLTLGNLRVINGFLMKF